MPANDAIRVLLVDDEARFLKTTKELLEKRGFSVMTAGGGSEACETIVKFPRDVVLLDIHMPVMDGYETLEKLRKQRPNMKFIMLTGYGASDPAADKLKEYIFATLRKPCGIELLEETILDAASGARKPAEPEPRVRDIMLPLSALREVKSDDLVSDAVNTIFESSIKTWGAEAVSDAAYRSAMVTDGDSGVVGIISFLDILGTLHTEYRRVTKSGPVKMYGETFHGPDFQGLYSAIAKETGNKRVRDVMPGKAHTVRGEDTLASAMHKFLASHTRHLLVMEGGKPAGILREQNLLYETAKIMRRKQDNPAKAPRMPD